MIIKKTFIKIFCLVISAVIIFLSGFIFGNKKAMENDELGKMALYLYDEIDKNFGDINKENKKDLNIIRGVNFYKDMGFGIILENNVKTIRVYKVIY